MKLRKKARKQKEGMKKKKKTGTATFMQRRRKPWLERTRDP